MVISNLSSFTVHLKDLLTTFLNIHLLKSFQHYRQSVLNQENKKPLLSFVLSGEDNLVRGRETSFKLEIPYNFSSTVHRKKDIAARWIFFLKSKSSQYRHTKFGEKIRNHFRIRGDTRILKTTHW